MPRILPPPAPNLTFGDMPKTGPPTRISTTPMAPYHYDEHNDISDALNDTKVQFNKHVNPVEQQPWFAVNGTVVPWAFLLNDVMYVSGTAQFNPSTTTITSGTDVAWTPAITDSGGAGTINASWKCHYTYMAPGLFHLQIQMVVTSAWSGVAAVQVGMPTGFKQGTMENILHGYTNKASTLGNHWPCMGIIHSVPSGSGGSRNGEAFDPPVMRFTVPTH